MSDLVEVEGLKLYGDLEHYSKVMMNYGMEIPTQKQFKFVEAFIASGGHGETAYRSAGYPVHANNLRWIRMKARTVKKSESVRALLQIAIADWFHKQEITVASITQKALDVYNTADTAKDKIAALRLISELGGLTKRPGRRCTGRSHRLPK